MVKINYSWNAEIRNPGRHADNDREFEEESVRERRRGTWEHSKGGTITSDRLIIDSDAHLGVFHFKFVRINIPIAVQKGGERSDRFQEQNKLLVENDMITVMSGMTSQITP